MNKRQTLLKILGNPKNWTITKIIIVLSVLIGIGITVLSGAYVNIEEINKQMQQNLTDVATQNAEILNSRFYEEYKLLRSLSKELVEITPDAIQEKLNEFQIYIDDFHVKRFAFCFPDGTTYSTDGDVTNLSYRSFFQKGMEGKSYITGSLADAIQTEHSPVNVMTIPICDETGNVDGVFGLAYDTDIFNAALQIDSFEGQGFSCIINESGEIIAAKANHTLDLSSNLLDNVLQNDPRNEQTISYLRDCMQQNTTGSGVMYLTGKNYYSCVPITLMDGSVSWYIFTIIPDEVLTTRVAPILRTLFVSSIITMILVLIGALTIIIFLKEQHRQMIHFAYKDPITGGANYTQFCMEMEKKPNPCGYLIALDIANFNNISIVSGLSANNTMIRETWQLITRFLHRDDLAGHVREDSFLLFLSEPEEEKMLQRMERLSKQIAEIARVFHVYGIRARYGIYQLKKPESIESAYSKAKIAREFEENNPLLDYAFYNEIDRKKIQQEKQLEERFPTALEKKEFEVWYQPKYSACDCTIVGSEALVRWREENGNMISPGTFIPLFERNGMITKLDEYMFRAVCSQQKKWLEEGKTVYPVSVNISRASLYSSDVEKRYSRILEEYGVNPQYIQLEITESVMDKGADICELLNRFRQIGIKILMDDFGTGYSSFATLSTQCFDTLKLDKSLIDHIGSQNGETMLYHIIRMGQQMALHITAEGVETPAQLAFLQHLKCDDIQGFYFSRPLSLADYETLINNISEASEQSH